MFKIIENRVEIPKTREPIKYRFKTSIKNIKQPLHLTDKDSNDNFFKIDKKPKKIYKNFVRETLFDSMGFQVIPNKIDKSTNTELIIQKSRIIQTENYFPIVEIEKKQEERLINFLNEIFSCFEEALIDNEIMDVYRDDLIIGNFDGNKAEQGTELSIIKELKSFEFENCNQKNVSAIRFFPELNIMAVSLVENFSYEERIDIKGRSFESYILLWNYEEFHRFTPIAILESPIEINCFEFKPGNENILVAGAINGQIFLYNIDKLTHKNGSDNLGFENNRFKKDMKDIHYFKPILSSSIMESFNANQNLIANEIYSRKQIHLCSHRTAVKSLFFLAPGISIEKKNPLNIIKLEKKTINKNTPREFFVTLSEDGHLLFWSLDFNDIKEKNKMKLENMNLSKIIWRACFSIQLFRDDKSCVQTSGMYLPKTFLGTEIYYTTLEGDLCLIDFDLKNNYLEESNYVDILKKKWKVDSEQIIITMDLSIFIDSLILEVGETCFYLFYKDSTSPVFISPFLQNAKLTSGKFSLSRPSVIYIGRDDGILDIWDFADQTASPSQQHLVSATGIDCIQVHSSKNNLLAVGDKDSCIHLLNLPNSLYQVNYEEKDNFVNFLEKENLKNKFYEEKYKELTNEVVVKETSNNSFNNNVFQRKKSKDFNKDDRDSENNLDDSYLKFLEIHFPENKENEIDIEEKPKKRK